MGCYCTICLESLYEGASCKPVALNCGHVFHAQWYLFCRFQFTLSLRSILPVTQKPEAKCPNCRGFIVQTIHLFCNVQDSINENEDAAASSQSSAEFIAQKTVDAANRQVAELQHQLMLMHEEFDALQQRHAHATHKFNLQSSKSTTLQLEIERYKFEKSEAENALFLERASHAQKIEAAERASSAAITRLKSQLQKWQKYEVCRDIWAAIDDADSVLGDKEAFLRAKCLMTPENLANEIEMWLVQNAALAKRVTLLEAQNRQLQQTLEENRRTTSVLHVEDSPMKFAESTSGHFYAKFLPKVHMSPASPYYNSPSDTEKRSLYAPAASISYIKRLKPETSEVQPPLSVTNKLHKTVVGRAIGKVHDGRGQFVRKCGLF